MSQSIFYCITYSCTFCHTANCRSRMNRISAANGVGRRPTATGGISGPCPPNHCLCPPKREMCPPSENCAPKKVTCSVPLECSSGLETPKILVINPVFVGKNRFFADFAMKTFFSWSSSQNVMKTFFMVFSLKFE